MGIVKALRSDCVAGYLQSVAELIHADIFGDFLEMADHLVDQGYKDPAAVIVGSVLEEHLRKLCDKSGVPTMQSGKPKKADTLNSELGGTGVYSKLDQKSVTAWLDLRNKADRAAFPLRSESEPYRSAQLRRPLEASRRGLFGFILAVPTMRKDRTSVFEPL